MSKRKASDELDAVEASDEDPQQQQSEHGESEQEQGGHEVIRPPLSHFPLTLAFVCCLYR
ncbi:hypothetical protein FRC12_001115 [Ceratobasidium sp. 428]|nr:hypothetical protein FRC12_001115 [Ceratobasidium sp. 428]